MSILFTDKTRWQHFWIGIVLGAVLTILCVLGAMTTAEWKDRAWGGQWDWKDWWCGMIGGITGQTVQVLIIYLIYQI